MVLISRNIEFLVNIPRVDGDGLLDDQTVADELTDVLAGVGIGDLVDLVGVEPDLLFATFHDTGG